MLVLGEDFQERIARQVAADGVEGQPRRLRAAHPQVDRGDAVPALEHRGGQVKRLVQLQRARLHGERPGGGARLGARVDQPHPHALARQPQRQHQPRRAGADDQYGRAGHARLRPRSLRRRRHLGWRRAAAIWPLRRSALRASSPSFVHLLSLLCCAAGGHAVRSLRIGTIAHARAPHAAGARSRTAGRLLLRSRAACADFTAGRSRPSSGAVPRLQHPRRNAWLPPAATRRPFAPRR